jgi:hypothetical protein
MKTKHNINEIIIQFSPLDYIGVLPQASSETVSKSFEEGNDLFIIGEQLASEPGQGLATKGGILWSSDMFPRIVNELYLLICTTDSTYDLWRTKISEDGSKTAKAVVLISSNAIAATIGLVPALIMPFVAIILAAIVKMSIQAWCKSQTENRQLSENYKKAISEELSNKIEKRIQ